MKLLSLVALGLAASLVHAEDYKLGAIRIEHPHARATVAGQAAGGGYLKLDNRGADDRLVAVRSPVSERVELHTMKLDGDVMRMRQLDTIEVPAGKTIELKPGGLHLMFMGLSAPLKVGDKFPLTLRFEKAGEVTVQVAVEAMRGEAMRHDMKH